MHRDQLLDEIRSGFACKLRPTKTVDKSRPVVLAEGEQLRTYCITKNRLSQTPAAQETPELLASTKTTVSPRSLKWRLKKDSIIDRDALLQDIRNGVKLRKICAPPPDPHPNDRISIDLDNCRVPIEATQAEKDRSSRITQCNGHAVLADNCLQGGNSNMQAFDCSENRKRRNSDRCLRASENSLRKMNSAQALSFWPSQNQEITSPSAIRKRSGNLNSSYHECNTKMAELRKCKSLDILNLAEYICAKSDHEQEINDQIISDQPKIDFDTADVHASRVESSTPTVSDQSEASKIDTDAPIREVGLSEMAISKSEIPKSMMWPPQPRSLDKRPHRSFDLGKPSCDFDALKQHFESNSRPQIDQSRGSTCVNLVNRNLVAIHTRKFENRASISDSKLNEARKGDQSSGQCSKIAQLMQMPVDDLKKFCFAIDLNDQSGQILRIKERHTD